MGVNQMASQFVLSIERKWAQVTFKLLYIEVLFPYVQCQLIVAFNRLAAIGANAFFARISDLGVNIPHMSHYIKSRVGRIVA